MIIVMLVHLTKSSPDPAYIQIADQIRRLIEDGLLEAGAKLPSVRDLARQLGVSVTTVHSAYDLLIAERLIETNQGSGIYVTEVSGGPGGTNLLLAGSIDYVTVPVDDEGPDTARHLPALERFVENGGAYGGGRGNGGGRGWRGGR